MSKSTYYEALDIVNEALEQPDNSVVFKHTALNELKKVIEQAQKQKELLDLYKEHFRLITVPKNACYQLVFYRLLVIQKEIEELENDV